MMRFFKNAHISAVAVLLGVSLVITQSAFKVEKSNRLDYLFEYTGPSAMSETDVENVANWTHNEDADCFEGDQFACAIRIDGAYVDATGANPVLKSTAAINANASGSAKARVLSTADGDILNTQE